MSEPTCYVMIGLPAIGKSTFINRIRDADTWIYSTDMFIDAVAEDNGLTYAEAFESNIKAATEFNERKVETMMKLKKDIIWDQTNLGKAKRKKIIDRMKKAGYLLQAVYFTSPETDEEIAEHKRRLNSRPGKIIPNHVLANMKESLVPPTIDEGFDVIQTYNMYGDLLSITYGDHR